MAVMSPLEKELAGVPGTNRDAYAAIKTLFDSYGLSSLAPQILQYLQNGYGPDTVSVLLQQSDAYKQRFAGNEVRKRNGLAVLTPAEYLSTEASYRQLLQAGGLDPAFMSSGNYSSWIGMDVSPTEMQSRVNLAVQATSQASPWLTKSFGQLGVSPGDLASYFLNDTHPTAQLQQKMNQAQIMAAAYDNGIAPLASRSMTFANMGVTQQQAQAGYQHIREVLPAATVLSSIYQNQKPYGMEQAEWEFLGQTGQDANTREALGRQETAAFSGQGGIGEKTLKPQGQPEM